MYEIWLLSKVEWEEADPNTIIENYVKRFPGINSNSSWKPLHEVLYSRPCASSGGTRCRWDRRRRFCTPRPPPRRRRSRSTSEERPSSLLATSAPSPYSRLLLRFLPWCANPQTYLDDLNFWKRILALQIWFQTWMIKYGDHHPTQPKKWRVEMGHHIFEGMQFANWGKIRSSCH